jgi:hypothetical protein
MASAGDGHHEMVDLRLRKNLVNAVDPVGAAYSSGRPRRCRHQSHLWAPLRKIHGSMHVSGTCSW